MGAVAKLNQVAVEPLCLPGSLMRLLQSIDGASDDVMARLASVEQRQHAVYWLPRVEAALAPAEPKWALSQVAALFATFPSQDVPREAWTAATLAYLEDLGEYPPDILAQAIRQARRAAQTFRPSPKDIRDQAEPLVTARRKEASGLRRLTRGPAAREQDPPRYSELTPEQQRQFDEMMAWFSARSQRAA